MNQRTWDDVDDYFLDRLGGDDAILAGALRRSAAAGLPPIAVAANQGKLLALLVASVDARTVLEVGTLGGYSTIWLARGLGPEGRIVTLELDPHHAEVARDNLAHAGLAKRVEVRVGPAVETLATLVDERFGPVDFTFIDADKAHNVDYFDAALALSRPGSLIVVDNVVRNGEVADAMSRDASVLGVRALADRIADEPRVVATVVQTVGSKGYDGLLIARVSRGVDVICSPSPVVR